MDEGVEEVTEEQDEDDEQRRGRERNGITNGSLVLVAFLFIPIYTILHGGFAKEGRERKGKERRGVKRVLLFYLFVYHSLFTLSNIFPAMLVLFVLLVVLSLLGMTVPISALYVTRRKYSRASYLLAIVRYLSILP